MTKQVILLSVPGLREKDVAAMQHLRKLTAGGEIADLVPSFPCVTCPVQANMTTGKLPAEHGVVANGFYWRKQRQVEMWTSQNECIQRPQIWDLLSHATHESAVGRVVPAAQPRVARPTTYARRRRSIIPTAASRCGATRGRWSSTARCATQLGHFPLQHFWGPLANIALDGLDRRLGRRRRPGAGSPTSSTSTCRTWIMPPSGTGPTARRPRRPWPSWTT